ncbi:MAG: DNA repair protein RadC [Gemmatimonadetes bacterium]|nr:DNA repair protein RadC [Gemmatimonadota bacterium]
MNREQPRDRLAELGPRALGLSELIAILIGSGSGGSSAIDIGRNLSKTVSGSARRLAALDLADLKRLPGLGEANSSRILAATELGRRAVSEPGAAAEYIRSGADVYRRFGVRLGDSLQEEFHALLLNARNRALSDHLITRGTLDASLVHPREVFRPAIVAGAAAVILVHNHPSGDPQPSDEDRLVTERLVEAGRLIGIPVMDHIVIGCAAWRSVMIEPAHFVAEGSDEGYRR